MSRHCILASLVFVVLLLLNGCSGSESTDEVVVYVSVDEHIARPILDRFERETGISVLMRGDTEATKNTGLVQRLRAERERPRADVFWSSEVFLTIQLASEGVLEAHETPESAAWPARLRDPQHRWHAFAQRARVVAFNTETVSESEVPRTMHDLLDGRWRSRLAMADPRFGTTRGHMGAALTLWGSETYRQWLMGMSENDVRLVDGNMTVVRRIASGEFDVGLTDTDDVWAAQREGWPVGLRYVRHDVPGGDAAGVLMIPNAVSRIAGGPNPDAAEELIAFLLSADVERMLAESDSHNIPIRPELQRAFEEYAVSDPLDLPYDAIAESMAPAIKAVDEVLR
jgi:iron(III) transport system substrate-binding protein